MKGRYSTVNACFFAINGISSSENARKKSLTVCQIVTDASRFRLLLTVITVCQSYKISIKKLLIVYQIGFKAQAVTSPFSFSTVNVFSKTAKWFL